jgi:bifunctional non-homologous end joining protein LigD
MLAALVAEPFDRPGWIFEVKGDGYRTVAEIRTGRVKLYSRNHVSFDRPFAPIAESLRQLGHDAVLDGEVVAVDEVGRSRFRLLQDFRRTGRGRLIYYVFDLLHLDGRDLRPLPLVHRKQILAELIGGLPRVLLSEHIPDQGVGLYRAAEEMGLEGIIAKDGASPYREGRHSGEWQKVKMVARQEAVIGGFTEPRGRRPGLGAVLLGVYAGGELQYVGHTGGELSDAELVELRRRLERFERPACPFVRRPKANAPVRWLQPRLVCEVKFAGWTADSRMRHPVFVGLREDKRARAVRGESPSQPTGLTASPATRRAS